jgi:hypothetical protein
MSTLLGNLKLYLLLSLTLMLLRKAQRNSERVRSLMREEDFVFQIQTVRGAGGHFALHRGAMSLKYGLHPKPDLVQIWASGNDAFRVMTSSDETDMLRAVDAGQCRMQGNFLIALWFNEVMKIARGRDSKRIVAFLSTSKT